MSRKAHQHAVKMLGQQGDRGIQAEQMAVIDDGNLIAQLLGLVHVVGGEHHRLALRLDRLDALPEVVARLGIEPRGGLVQKQQLGVAEQGQRQQQPLPLTAGELAAVPIDEFSQRTQLDELGLGQGGRVEAGEQPQGIAHRQEILQRRVLELDADARAVVGTAGGSVEQDLAAVRGEDPLQQLDGGGLARPVRAEQAETAAGGNGKAEPVHRLDAGEVLDEIDDFNDGSHGRSPSRSHDYIQKRRRCPCPAVRGAKKQTATLGSPSVSIKPAGSQDVQQLHFEYQGGVRRDGTGTACAVGQILRNVELPLGANRHQLQRFYPTGDHASYREFGRLAAGDGAVEHATVGEGTVVVHTDGLTGYRYGTVAFHQHFVLQTGLGGLHFGALGVVGQEGFAFGGGSLGDGFLLFLHAGSDDLEGIVDIVTADRELQTIQGICQTLLQGRDIQTGEGLLRQLITHVAADAIAGLLFDRVVLGH